MFIMRLFQILLAANLQKVFNYRGKKDRKKADLGKPYAGAADFNLQIKQIRLSLQPALETLLNIFISTC